MKKVAILGAALALYTTSAFAVGADLSACACPGVSGATPNAGALDCANGMYLTLFVVFQPGESAPDLTGIDIVLDVSAAGDLNAGSRFWNFESGNAAALSVSRVRPPVVCDAYTDTWSANNGGEGVLAYVAGPRVERIKALAYRGSPLAYTVNQKMFGMTFGIDAFTAPEAGGSGGPGCNQPVCFYLTDVFPRLVSGNATQDLGGPSVFGNAVTINGATTSLCLIVPTRKQTWGQLKSMYR